VFFRSGLLEWSFGVFFQGVFAGCSFGVFSFGVVFGVFFRSLRPLENNLQVLPAFYVKIIYVLDMDEVDDLDNKDMYCRNQSTTSKTTSRSTAFGHLSRNSQNGKPCRHSIVSLGAIYSHPCV